MSIESRIATNQPNSFKFSKENEAEIRHNRRWQDRWQAKVFVIR